MKILGLRMGSLKSAAIATALLALKRSIRLESHLIQKQATITRQDTPKWALLNLLPFK